MAINLSLKGAEKAMEILMDADKVPALVGTSGIGKTELVQKVASDRNAMYVSITCSLMQEGDLMLPIPQTNTNSAMTDKLIRLLLLQNAGLESKEEMEELLQEVSRERSIDGTNAVIRAIDEDIVKIIKYLDENPEGEAILFLDEINRASTAVMAELMNLVLARELKGTKLPENCKIVVAMNPSSDMDGYNDTNYSVNSGDLAINDRLAFLFLQPTLQDWIDWGMEYGEDGESKVDTRIMEFLSEQPEPEKLFIPDENEQFIIATPRSWKDTSDILRQYEKSGLQDRSILIAMIQGKVGDDAAASLASYLDNINNFISINDILTVEPELSQDIKNKFKQTSEIRKNTLLKQTVSRVENDIKNIQLNPQEQSNPKYAYLAEGHYIKKITKLIELMGELASDNSVGVMRFIKNKTPQAWDKFAEYDGFIALAMKNHATINM